MIVMIITAIDEPTPLMCGSRTAVLVLPRKIFNMTVTDLLDIYMTVQFNMNLIMVHRLGRCLTFFIFYSAQHIKCA